jgi:hypothetical protein
MNEALEVMSGDFIWSVADCCTSACDVFNRVHGVDPMAPLRGKYHDMRGAMEIIRGYGGFGLMADMLAGQANLRSSDAVPGAIGLFERSLVICVAPGRWAGKAKRGLVFVTKVDRAWYV